MPHPVLARNLFLVKEHVGLFRAANNYDIYDPQTAQIVLQCREPSLGWFTKLLRLTDYKRYTPFDIEVRTPAQELVLGVRRGWTFIRSRVTVTDGQGRVLGGFRQKPLSAFGDFEVLDEADRPVILLEGKWTSWEFAFKAGDQQLARVTKQWSGIGRELFTTADTYMLEIASAVPKDSAVRQMIMASVLCIDMVLKER